MNKKNIGSAYEELAVNFLVSNGHDILMRNFTASNAEIDIISKEKQSDNPCGISEYIVFTEVKYRNSADHGNPYEAVGAMKQKKICRAALYYLRKYGFSADTPVRFDVISIVDTEITWISNAFEYVF